MNTEGAWGDDVMVSGVVVLCCVVLCCVVLFCAPFGIAGRGMLHTLVLFK